MTSHPACPSRESVEVDGFTFPPFDLGRLLRTVFVLTPGESFGVFTDLPDPRAVARLRFLEAPCLPARRHAYHTLYHGLLKQSKQLRLASASFYAYRETGASNLDLPASVFTPDGEELPLRDALARHGIVLFCGRFSATAPVTALAREMGFRGATLHGLNDKVLATGLSVDYEQVSAHAERLRAAVDGAESVRMEWEVEGRPVVLDLDLRGVAAQKSHGLVREMGDVANLPAGEVYWVPAGAEGILPRKFEDPAGTIALFRVQQGRITGMERFVRGDRELVERYLATIASDPHAGSITELGLGTQSLPFAGTDIQDEKILGTAHLATGRSDHLGGSVGPESFRHPQNASHDDILFSPPKTPEIPLRSVSMLKSGHMSLLLDDGVRCRGKTAGNVIFR